jgi:hypothetical protein
MVVTLDVTELKRTGEYTGVLSLDPTAESAATIDLTVKARHAFVWPLLTVFIGASIAWFGRWYYVRRQLRRARKKQDQVDPRLYLPVLLFAAVAFLLPIYAATDFGTLEQYLSVFVAGILGNVVVDKALVQPAELPVADDPAARAAVGSKARARRTPD